MILILISFQFLLDPNSFLCEKSLSILKVLFFYNSNNNIEITEKKEIYLIKSYVPLKIQSILFSSSTSKDEH